MERRTRERHRLVPSADLDRLDTTRGLWAESGPDARGLLRDAVRAAIAEALTDKQRAVVEACFFEGLSQGEAARRLGITQQVVSKTLHGAPRDGRIVGGALRKLREVLAPVVADLRASS
ncbi:MAG: sigma factor-like helix-turn-helix DNA-binding protein [Minicystis sp.]